MPPTARHAPLKCEAWWHSAHAPLSCTLHATWNAITKSCARLRDLVCNRRLLFLFKYFASNKAFEVTAKFGHYHAHLLQYKQNIHDVFVLWGYFIDVKFPAMKDESLTSSEGTTMSWISRMFLCVFWRRSNLIIETLIKQRKHLRDQQWCIVTSLFNESYRQRTSRTVVWSREPSASLAAKVFMAKWRPSSSNTWEGGWYAFCKISHAAKAIN